MAKPKDNLKIHSYSDRDYCIDDCPYNEKWAYKIRYEIRDGNKIIRGPFDTKTAARKALKTIRWKRALEHQQLIHSSIFDALESSRIAPFIDRSKIEHKPKNEYWLSLWFYPATYEVDADTSILVWTDTARSPLGLLPAAVDASLEEYWDDHGDTIQLAYDLGLLAEKCKKDRDGSIKAIRRLIERYA